MGDFRVRTITDEQDRQRMHHHALQDLEAFQQMWEDRVFTKGEIHIGAEQELCLVDRAFRPSKSALRILEAIDHPLYTNELALYNMEVNLDPMPLHGACFSQMEDRLLALLDIGRKQAAKIDEQVVLTGILPTIDQLHLAFDYMTPIPRYKALSEVLHKIRGASFEMYMQGADDFMATSDSILYEACNTSFQMHLQIDQDKFVDKHNWSQVIAAPVLGAAVNAPLLFGKELWRESRIAIFKQSIDTRNSAYHQRTLMPRVYFGDDWLKDSPVNLWKNELARFPLLITSDELPDSLAVLEAGNIPKLRAIRLHNGTTYTWNRLCYGPGTKPHLRIECRYIPAGPSPVDEMANFVFWVGLMHQVPQDMKALTETTSFKDVKLNFLKAARSGLQTVLQWGGQPIPMAQLILEKLLPMASAGLESCDVDRADIDRYLGVIEKRVRSGQTGAEWTIRNYRRNKDKYGPLIARQELVSQSIAYQSENIPVHEWSDDRSGAVVQSINADKISLKVEHLMTTDLYCIRGKASVELARSITQWQGIRHLPVEDDCGNLVGILTDGMIERTLQSGSGPTAIVRDIMNPDVIAVDKTALVKDFIDLLKKHQLTGLPVVSQQKLVGVITTVDLMKAGYTAEDLRPRL